MKLVVISFGAGDLNSGFPCITAQIWKTGNSFPSKFTASLPTNTELLKLYQRLEIEYTSLQQLNFRIQIVETSGITNISSVDFSQVCLEFNHAFNHWLLSQTFNKLEKQLRTHLDVNDEILLLIESNDIVLNKLPWHLWHFWEDYPNLEIGLSASQYAPPNRGDGLISGQVRILAVLGDRTGIDVESDRALLNTLPAEVHFLVEPSIAELNQALWDETGWDIFFFAGHSSTDISNGYMDINAEEKLTIDKLKYSLKKACTKGLQLAIFNSCDGLGLAYKLAELNIPQTIVMREIVPDLVAQEFVKFLLPSFASGNSLTLAIREARERLHTIEPKFSCASWLPVLYQNPAAPLKKWNQLGRAQKIDSPYRGLLPFRPEHSSFFKGRDTLTQKLYETVKEKSLVAVVGASGSGKSSLVFAGLIPKLQKKENWTIFQLRPGKQPLSNLMTTFLPVIKLDIDDEKVFLQALRQEKDMFKLSIKDWSWQQENILLIIDQFEELYTLCEDRLEQAYFIDQLLEAVKNIANFKIVITLRADFLENAIAFRPLADALQQADIKVSPMNFEELKQAIIAPAHQIGITLEDGLVERILEAVENQPSNLALLQFTLTLLWEKRNEHKLTHKAYDEIGTVKQAISIYAENIYNKLFIQEQKIAKKIFLALIEVDEEKQAYRRQIDKAALLNTNDLNQIFEEVLGKLIEVKLVVISVREKENKIVIDLAHEALIKNWQRLNNWVDENRDILQTAQRLEIDAKFWQEKGQPLTGGYLLEGAKLYEAKELLKRNDSEISLSSLARKFIEKSIKIKQIKRIKNYSLIPGIILIISALLVWDGLVRYDRYWHGTIQKIQTVDFNILSHLLPYKLSSALIREDFEELQNIIDSNYGLFGIVVTDCKSEEKYCLNQKILYTSNSSREWKQELEVTSLSEHPYNLLKNPPPFTTEKRFDSPSDFYPYPTEKVNEGEIIGRVYYIRQQPPSFLESFWTTWKHNLSL